MTYSNYHSCRDALRVPEYSHICVTNQALASKQKIQTDEDRKQKLVNGLYKQLAVSRSKVLIRFSEFFIHDPKKNNLFFLTLLAWGLDYSGNRSRWCIH